MTARRPVPPPRRHLAPVTLVGGLVLLAGGCALRAGPLPGHPVPPAAARVADAAELVSTRLPPIAVAGLVAAVCRETWPSRCELPELPVLRDDRGGFEVRVVRDHTGDGVPLADAGLEHHRDIDGDLDPLAGWRVAPASTGHRLPRPDDEPRDLLIRVVVEPDGVGSLVTVQTGSGVTPARARTSILRNLELAAALSDAEQRLAAGDPAQAAQLADLALRRADPAGIRRPDPVGLRAALHRLLARLAAARGDSDTAQEQLALACAAAPRDTAAWAELAAARTRLARPDEAARAVRRVQRDGQDRALAWRTLARWSRGAAAQPATDRPDRIAAAEAQRWLVAGGADEARAWDVRGRALGNRSLLPAPGLATDRRGVELQRRAALVGELAGLHDAPTDARLVERAIAHAVESGQPDVALRLSSRHWLALHRARPERATALHEQLIRTVGPERSRRICQLESRSAGPADADIAGRRGGRDAAATAVSAFGQPDLATGASGIEFAAPAR